MNSAKPIWIEDYVITKKILLGFIKKCSNGVARPSFVITERSIPELFDYNNVDTEFLWSLIEILQNEFDVVEIRLQNVKVHEPIYLKAKLFFKSESLAMLHDWFSEELKPKQVKDVDFYSSNAWKRLRFKAFELHGNICQCCGARPPGVVLEVDHIKPRSIYPELALELDNLQILCRACNSGKSNRYDSDFRGAS